MPRSASPATRPSASPVAATRSCRVVRAARKSAGKNAGRASQQIGGDGGGRDRQRNIVGSVETGADKGLDADRRHGQHAEVGEAKQDRLLAEELDAVSQGVLRGTRAVSAAAQHAALCREQRQRNQPRRAHHQQRGSPAEDVAEPVADDGRQRVAQAAADTVRAVRMAETARGDVGIEHREIGRMKDAVADAHDRGQWKQPEDAGNAASKERTAGEQGQPAEKHRPGPEAVDGEARAKLAQRARNVKSAHQRTQGRIAHAEFRAQQWKQRRQDELEEVRHAVRDTDHADHADIAAKG